MTIELPLMISNDRTFLLKVLNGETLQKHNKEETLREYKHIFNKLKIKRDTLYYCGNIPVSPINDGFDVELFDDILWLCCMMTFVSKDTPPLPTHLPVTVAVTRIDMTIKYQEYDPYENVFVNSDKLLHLKIKDGINGNSFITL